jgi:hypothetical protein
MDQTHERDRWTVCLLARGDARRLCLLPAAMRALGAAVAIPRRKLSGTNGMVGICHDVPASLSPSPRAWPAALGAADMPIGCALPFFQSEKMRADKPAREAPRRRQWPGRGPAIAQIKKQNIAGVRPDPSRA